MKRRLADLRWDNSFARLPAGFYQRVSPSPLAGARLAAFNPDGADLLDLDPAEAERPGFVAALNGEAPLPGSEPLAAIYAGYQFGVWVPQLGDGRAILLGEVVNQRHQRWDVQVKGAGLTRFSRMGDGRAVLRSTIREYLAGEAMHGLGIPTTRSLAILAGTEPVYRETTETGAVLVRLAPTHVRFGSFELFASRGADAAVRRLADYVIEAQFPHLQAVPSDQRHASWYAEVVDRTARLMAQWTASGFTHGVLNTDNMSIAGLSLDYGPFAWMDRYDPGLIPNHSDPGGRYAFDQQPAVGLWNCARLGEALHSLVDTEQAVAALDRYRSVFISELDRRYRSRLGLRDAEPDDPALVASLLEVLFAAGVDYTGFFRSLCDFPATGVLAPPFDASAVPRLGDWLQRYAARLAREPRDAAERTGVMLAANPKYVLRTWIAQEAIADAQAGNFATIDRLRTILADPFAEHPGMERYAGGPPAGAPAVALSCSS